MGPKQRPAENLNRDRGPSLRINSKALNVRQGLGSGQNLMVDVEASDFWDETEATIDVTVF